MRPNSAIKCRKIMQNSAIALAIAALLAGCATGPSYPSANKPQDWTYVTEASASKDRYYATITGFNGDIVSQAALVRLAQAVKVNNAGTPMLVKSAMYSEEHNCSTGQFRHTYAAWHEYENGTGRHVVASPRNGGAWDQVKSGTVAGNLHTHACNGLQAKRNASGEVASFLLEVVALPFLAGAAEGRANLLKPRESYTCMHMGVMTNCTKD